MRRGERQRILDEEPSFGMAWVHRWLEVWIHIGWGWEFLRDSLKIVGITLFIMGKCLHRGKWCFQKINLAEVDKINWRWTDWWRGNQLTGYSKTLGVTGLRHWGQVWGRNWLEGHSEKNYQTMATDWIPALKQNQASRISLGFHGWGTLGRTQVQMENDLMSFMQTELSY